MRRQLSSPLTCGLTVAVVLVLGGCSSLPSPTASPAHAGTGVLGATTEPLGAREGSAGTASPAGRRVDTHC